MYKSVTVEAPTGFLLDYVVRDLLEAQFYCLQLHVSKRNLFPVLSPRYPGSKFSSTRAKLPQCLAWQFSSIRAKLLVTMILV